LRITVLCRSPLDPHPSPPASTRSRTTGIFPRFAETPSTSNIDRPLTHRLRSTIRTKNLIENDFHFRPFVL
jgi:hypothetical protein